jgi:hypothetical protein
MRRSIVLSAAVATALVALPAAAGAQGAFPIYRQAATDQYGGPPGKSPGEPGQPGPPPGRPPGHGKPGHDGRPRTSTEGEVLGNRSASAAPVRVESATATATRDLPRGSLPFTGGDLTIVVLLAAGLLAAGALGAAAARAARRRRRLA